MATINRGSSLIASIKAAKYFASNHWCRDAIQRICLVPDRPVRPAIPQGPAPRHMPAAMRRAYGNDIAVWKADFEDRRPIVYWLTEVLPELVEGYAERSSRRYYHVKDRLHNFFVMRADRFDTGISRWEYESPDHVMLAANFRQLVKYVETTYAARYVNNRRHFFKREAHLDPIKEKEWEKIQTKVRRHHYWNFKQFRSREYALAYLHEVLEAPADEFDEDNEEFKRMATTLALYLWWTDIRPNRGDAEVVSGLAAFRARMQEGEDSHWSFSKMTPAEQTEYRQLMILDDELLKAWMQEDTDMLVKLIKERHNIWY